MKTDVEIVLKFKVRLQVLDQIESEIESPAELEAFKTFRSERENLILPPPWVTLDLEDF